MTPPTSPQPAPGSKLIVTASSLNVRRTPTLQGVIIGSLANGDIVDWLATSDDQVWAQVSIGSLKGWSSLRFLRPVTTAPATPLDAIINIAAGSAIARFDWANRGTAPLGYIKGMALTYARVYCKLKAGDAAATEMAKANTGHTATDALAHYSGLFHAAGMDNESSGSSTLRHLFVLLVGLGMRESSGRFCEGRDRAATNTTAATAEAGLFQTSFNARTASPLMPQIFAAYSASPAGFLEVFKEGVTPKPADLQNFGSGEGRAFQQLSKESPAFAVEFAAVGLRNIRSHWGPINTRKAEIRPECNTMLLKVEQAVDAAGLCPV